MKAMTRRERLTAIFYGKTPDRSAVKIWGAEPWQKCVHPAFKAVRDLAAAKTDLVLYACSPGDIHAGANRDKVIESHDEPTDQVQWVNQVTVYHTPMGDLREVYLRSTIQKPGYDREYLLKEPADIRKLLSISYEQPPFDASSYRKTEARLGDAGITYFGLDHPMYALQRKIGPENFALWSLDEGERMREAIETFAARLRQQVRQAIDAGVRGVFGWVGPEVCIPPLMSPGAFERWVFDVDRPLIDMIHNAGGRVWVHVHGRMKRMIARLADMGIDVLNPIEPPPMGDVSLAEAFALVDGRMGLEGNIETHDLMTAATPVLREKIHRALDDSKGRRHILCPSSGYQENVAPTPAEIDNWMFYISEGVRYAQELADG